MQYTSRLKIRYAEKPIIRVINKEVETADLEEAENTIEVNS
jgi:hypothetical protein